MSLSSKQHTLAKKVSYSGIGLHTGTQVNLAFCPAPEGTGILFKRTDLPGHPIIPATIEYVTATNRSTTLGIGEINIHTVEHVLAAIKAYQIDNLIIEISSIEPPIANGSADTFCTLIEEAGLEEQNAEMPITTLKKPVYFSEGEIHIVAIPADRYQISYTLSYPESKVLGAQFYSCTVTPATFREEIAPCRTFAKYEEITYLMDRGLIKGGSLDNAVIIKEDAVISKEGLFFPNEMARHKVLDLIGDLALVGIAFTAHVIAIRSGHAANVAFAKKLLAHITQKEPVCHGSI